jgi:hypothetical protein
MKKAILTTSVLIISLVSPVYGRPPNWELMFSTPDIGGPRTAWYVDRDSLSLQGRILTAWILLNFGHPMSQQMADGKFQNFRSSRSLIYINCATHRVATVEDKEYREPFGEGKSHTVVYGPEDPQSKRLRWEDPQLFRDADKESGFLCKQTRIAYSPEKDVAMTSRLDVEGVVSQMEVSPARGNILVAAATPNRIPGPGDVFGVYTFSTKNPESLQRLGFFPVLDAENLALSGDGRIAYALAPRRGGYPQDSKYYGLFVLDISDPKNPRLLAHVGGSFFSMGLAADGNVLFLQELHAAWADHNEEESRIRAYRLRDGVPTEYCSVDFGTPKRNSEIFAYSFLRFVDSPYLVINSRGVEAIVLNVANPCKPITVGDVVSSVGGISAGWKEARILAGVHGLVSFQYTEPQSERRLYRSHFKFLSAVRVFDAGAMVTAVGPNEVFVFDGEKDNCFHEARSFHVKGAADDLVESDSMLYVGGENFIAATRMTAGQVLSSNSRLDRSVCQ